MSQVAEAEPEAKEVSLQDYSLVGENSKRAVEQGLAEADWYQSPVPRETMRELLERKDGPGIRDTIIWFALLGLFGALGVALWGSWWAILPFAAYGVIYGSTSDSRWHESSHGTAFKTDWMNNALYEISSFMVMRESTLWRWSHTRHHSDTIIVGRDPEIAVPRPPDLKTFALTFFGIPGMMAYFKKITKHATGHLYPDEETFIPESERGKIYLRARIYVLIYLGVIALCFSMGSILPLLFIGLPNIYGAWLMPIYGFTQHTGLAENVLDHRMNCRTVKMNIINRFLYWNMNYHVEHHMFPLVPYHNLPRLYDIVKDDMPTPYRSIVHAWSEIIPAVLKQVKDPGYFVKRTLPTPTVPGAANIAAKTIISSGREDADGWVEIAAADQLDREDVLRFDHKEHTFAVYRTEDDTVYATDGICTHGNTHLATGMVKGCLIECPKHNGRFDVRDGSPQRAPVCVPLKTYPVEERDGVLFMQPGKAQGKGTEEQTTYRFKVVSNQNVATYIRELVLEPTEDSPALSYEPGHYLQFNIPAYGTIPFSAFDVDEPYNSVWKAQHVTDYTSENHTEVRRNYSFASNPHRDETFRFNIRIATPPTGQDCNAGVGSAYMWNLKAGDEISAIGPFGDFMINKSNREMIYVGGGSGMAPLRSHLSTLFETIRTGRKVSFWYGARSRQELFYQDYFEQLAEKYENFTFHPALSEPLPEDKWEGPTGYIHQVLNDQYLITHEAAADAEYYLCGPQPMVQALRAMLEDYQVDADQVAFDEF